MITTEKVEYQDSELSYEGMLAYNAKNEEKVPVIMIAHAYGGQSKFEENIAIEIAKLGYIGFAIDIYGKGIRAKSPDEALQLMGTLNSNRSLLLDRMKTSLNVCKSLKLVDKKNIGAIGYCFGGKCVLDLARSGEKIKGVVSFHGVYDAPKFQKNNTIETPVLVLHGWDDPLAKPNNVIELTQELTKKEADWELNAYGHTGHSFTNPNANAPERGMFYQQEADRKSWNRMVAFFKNKFKK